MERMWFMLSILTFLIAIYMSVQNNVYDALYFFGFSVIAIFLFFMRRRQRMFHERKEAEEKGK